MKVCVRMHDPRLTRALVDLLRGGGHDALPLEQCTAACELRIQSDMPTGGGSGQFATLVLSRSTDSAVSDQPRTALIEALRTGGVAVWRSPFDAGQLLSVLGDESRLELATPTEGWVPHLTDAPYAWLLIEADEGRLLAANQAARHLLNLPHEVNGLWLSDLALPGHLREGLYEESDGIRTGEVAGRGSLVAWWTDRRGRRVACFFDAPGLDTPAVRHRQALAELGKMAATLAHEIRNPVASVAGALDIFESEEDPEDRAEVLQMARERVRQLAALLDKTLNLARPIHGPPEDIQLRAALDSALSTISLSSAMRDVRVEMDVPENISAQAYLGPLVQALTNVLLNAAQAQNGKGVIRVSLTTDVRRAILRIHDEGPGIPQTKRKEIFKPFYTTRIDGTGLGLAEVQRALRASGGAISVEDVEEGACMLIELPLAEAHTSRPGGGHRAAPSE